MCQIKLIGYYWNVQLAFSSSFILSKHGYILSSISRPKRVPLSRSEKETARYFAKMSLNIMPSTSIPACRFIFLLRISFFSARITWNLHCENRIMKRANPISELKNSKTLALQFTCRLEIFVFGASRMYTLNLWTTLCYLRGLYRNRLRQYNDLVSQWFRDKWVVSLS